MIGRRFVWMISISMIFLAACGSLGVDKAATGTAEVSATQVFLTAQAVTELAVKATRDASVTQTAQAKLTVEAKAIAGTATQIAFEQAATLSAQGTATAVLGATETRQAKLETEKADQVARVTATALEKTESAQPMFDLVSQMVEDLIIENGSGRYSDMDMFDQSWAQLGWFRFYDTYVNPKDFVISAHFTWDSASDKADPWFSGCGFVYRASDSDHYYMTYLGLDGYVRIYRFNGGTDKLLGEKYYDKVGFPIGSADFILAVEKDAMTVLVNQKKVLHVHDTAFDTGGLYYTLVSGTNKGYGFHCKMTKVGLWEIK